MQILNSISKYNKVNVNSNIQLKFFINKKNTKKPQRYCKKQIYKGWMKSKNSYIICNWVKN